MFLNPFQYLKDKKYNTFYVIYSALRRYQRERIAKSNLILNIEKFNLAEKVSFFEKEATYVIVIGESTARNHMGLYGYYRDTNPCLSGDTSLYVFKDVVSPSTHTHVSVPLMLTLRSGKAHDQWFTSPDLLSLFKASGFKTYWISNQEADGIAVSTLAGVADYQFFSSQGNNGSIEKNVHDEELLGVFDQVLKEKIDKKLIVLHLIGAHLFYKDRYPDSFEVFHDDSLQTEGRSFLDDGRKEIINAYDNAVLYNDYVVSQLISRLKKINTVSYLVYSSDHGEEVYDARDFFGHTYSIGSRYMVEVPFIIWLSDQYKSMYPTTANHIKMALDQPYMNDDFSHTVLDLSHVQYQEFLSEKSLINPLLDTKRRRYIAQVDYDKKWKDVLPTLSGPQFEEKLFLHRANTIQKMRLFEGKYIGFEIDVVFDQRLNEFDIYHPPQSSIGLYLDDYLKKIGNVQQKRIWLDFKNLNETNYKHALERLSILMQKYGMRRNQLILESSNPDFLSHFKSHVFTSYYLPILPIGGMDTSQKYTASLSLIDEVQKSEADAVSYPADMHEFVKTYIHTSFPEKKLLTWILEDMSNFENILRLRMLLLENSVEVVLLGERTNFDY